METEFVSIGPCCYTTEYIKNSGLRNHSYHAQDNINLYLHVESMYNSMQRKCNRFLDLLNSNKKIFLVYIIKYIPLFEFTKELNEVIYFRNS